MVIGGTGVRSRCLEDWAGGQDAGPPTLWSWQVKDRGHLVSVGEGEMAKGRSWRPRGTLFVAHIHSSTITKCKNLEYFDSSLSNTAWLELARGDVYSFTHLAWLFVDSTAETCMLLLMGRSHGFHWECLIICGICSKSLSKTWNILNSTSSSGLQLFEQGTVNLFPG